MTGSDIQETLLFLPRTERGRDPIHLRQLQPLTRIADWGEQRKRWQALLSNREPAPSRGCLPEQAAGEGWFPRTMWGCINLKNAGPLSWPDVVRSEKSNPLVNRGTC